MGRWRRKPRDADFEAALVAGFVSSRRFEAIWDSFGHADFEANWDRVAANVLKQHLLQDFLVKHEAKKFRSHFGSTILAQRVWLNL